MAARRRICRKRGVTTAGLVVGMTALLAFVAVAVDLSILNSCGTEARAAGDAAALAGAAELWDRSLLPPHLQSLGLPASDSTYQSRTVMERQLRHCGDRVCQVAAMNTVGGKPVDVLEEDMSFSMLAGGPALTVQCSFTSQRGNPVSRIIGRTLGMSDADLQIASQAVLDQRVVGFAASATANAPVLPIVIDEDLWNTQVAASSIVTIQIHAAGSEAIAGATLCSLRVAAADVIVDHRMIAPPTVVGQIYSGIRKADLANLPGQAIALSQDATRPLTLPVETVSTDSLRDIGVALNGIAGRPRVWMLGAQTADQDGVVGCRVVSFVAARILACSVDGEHLTAVLQPCLFSTSTALVRAGQPRNPWLAKVCLVQ